MYRLKKFQNLGLYINFCLLFNAGKDTNRGGKEFMTELTFEYFHIWSVSWNSKISFEMVYFGEQTKIRGNVED